MEQEKKNSFSLTTGTDLAFALVVFISFFTIFSSAPITKPVAILIIIFLGIAYVTFGIYGFAYAQKSKTNPTKFGYFIVQLFLGGCIVYFGKGAGINALVLLPLVAHTAMLLDQDRVLIVNVGIIATYVLSVLAYSGNLQEVWKGAPFFFAGQVVILIFTQMAVTELNARIRLESLAEELSVANKHLQDYAYRVQELTITQERNRMAREIHDGLGHYLTLLNMELKAAAATFNKDRNKSAKMLDNAIHITSEALIDVRNSVFALRQEPGQIKPLQERIQAIVEASSSNEMEFKMSVLGNPTQVSPQIDLTLYRAAQEMANNAIKHSGAHNVNLTLDYSVQNKITLSCEDNGQGKNSFENGFGILGLQERVKLLNGDIEIKTEPEMGFRITIRIPSYYDN